MNKSDQAFFDKWKKDGLKELARKRKIPKATKKQQAAWNSIINGEK